MTTLTRREDSKGHDTHPLYPHFGQTVQLQRPFDPVVTFLNSQGEAARGTLTITSLAEESRPPAAAGGDHR